MNSAEEQLREIVAKVLLLKESEVTDAISRKDTESWDSLAHLMLVNEVEAAFNVTLSDDDIVELKTVGELKQKLRNLGVQIH